MHRFRPILLTAAAAILGMIPIAPTMFWGPMAYAIMGGLAVATLLTLVFLPALYVAWFRIKQPARGREPGHRSRATDRHSHLIDARGRRLCIIDPTLLSPLSALLGALVGGVASLLARHSTRNARKIVFSGSRPRSRNGRPFTPTS